MSIFCAVCFWVYIVTISFKYLNIISSGFVWPLRYEFIAAFMNTSTALSLTPISFFSGLAAVIHLSWLFRACWLDYAKLWTFQYQKTISHFFTPSTCANILI